MFQANGPRKQVGITVPISDKTDFPPKLVRKDKEGHFMLMKWTVSQDNAIILNVYVLRCTQFHQQMLLEIKPQMNPNAVIVDESNTPISPVDKSYGEKRNRGTSGVK